MFDTTYDTNLYNILVYKKNVQHITNNIWNILHTVWLHARLHIIKNLATYTFVRVCEREREREREPEWVRVCMCVCVSVCVRVD